MYNNTQNRQASKRTSSTPGPEEIARMCSAASAYIAHLFNVPESVHPTLSLMAALPVFIGEVIRGADIPGVMEKATKALMLLQRVHDRSPRWLESMKGAGAGHKLFVAAMMVVIGTKAYTPERWDEIWGVAFTYPDVEITAEDIKKSLKNNSEIKQQRVREFKEMIFRDFGENQ